MDKSRSRSYRKNVSKINEKESKKKNVRRRRENEKQDEWHNRKMSCIFNKATIFLIKFHI